ncbi:MAG: hypothetical protein R2705_07565 [Ilumatobacteraceae bacterium]
MVGGALAIGGVALVTLLQTRLEDAARSAATLRARDVAALATSDALPAVLALPGEEDAFVQVVATDGRVLAASENIDGEPAFTDLVPALGQQLRWTGALKRDRSPGTDVDHRAPESTPGPIAPRSTPARVRAPRRRSARFVRC